MSINYQQIGALKYDFNGIVNSLLSARWSTVPTFDTEWTISAKTGAALSELLGLSSESTLIEIQNELERLLGLGLDALKTSCDKLNSKFSVWGAASGDNSIAAYGFTHTAFNYQISVFANDSKIQISATPNDSYKLYGQVVVAVPYGADTDSTDSETGEIISASNPIGVVVKAYECSVKDNLIPAIHENLAAMIPHVSAIYLDKINGLTENKPKLYYNPLNATYSFSSSSLPAVFETSSTFNINNGTDFLMNAKTLAEEFKASVKSYITELYVSSN